MKPRPPGEFADVEKRGAPRFKNTRGVQCDYKSSWHTRNSTRNTQQAASPIRNILVECRYAAAVNVNFAAFGKFLRSLRTAAGLSLREVADLTRLQKPPHGEPLSFAYLSRLESGKMRRPSPLKLAALASAYEVSVSLLIDAAPEALQRQLLMSGVKFAGTAERFSAADARLAVLLPSMVFPPGFESVFFAQMRMVIALLIVTPWIAERRERAFSWWTDAHSSHLFWWERAFSAEGLADTWSLWGRLVEACCEAVLLHSESLEQAAGAVNGVRADSYRDVASVLFADRRTNARWGFSDVPLTLATSVRKAQLARLLWKATPDGLALPEPPTITDAIQYYFHGLFAPRPGKPLSAGCPQLGAALRLAKAFADGMPDALMSGPHPLDERHGAIRAFLSQLGSPSETKTRRNRSPKTGRTRPP